MSALIALLTDFGNRDSYVGVMKGVIARIAPGVQVIDLLHEVRPQSVSHAAYALYMAVPYFPTGTIFCCVVDPGVGSERLAVAAEIGEWTFILPDNGIVTRVLDHWPAHRAVSLSNPTYQLPHPSFTFHGRDIFAPAAAHLTMGVPLEALGEAIAVEALQRLDLPTTYTEENHVSGSVMHVDHFGNLITTISQAHLGQQRDWQIHLAGMEMVLSEISTTFADVPPGQPVAYIGSDGFLELAIRNSSAAALWGCNVGTEVWAERKEGD